MLYKKLLITTILLLITSCSKPTYQSQKSALIVIKTQSLKYADMGFIYNNSDNTKVEIYSNGVASLSLEIYKNSICMGDFKCIEPNKFNNKFFASSYPKSFVTNIFNQRAIFGSKNLIKTSKGFIQKIKSDKYDIEYSLSAKKSIFRDKINNILIKINIME
ncbi:Putative lipoprotein [hydrothermal vent metagenome]|uniref:Putative lipoprotein n=1 Tax=hydrothermal vent metagenome TaxID=652676 RepID=A0A1W1EHN4_9ZZZZ